ncbi:MAG: MBL fold metallo-hydrolase [Pararhizobium sp.]
MTAFICNACGTQYPETEAAPPRCPICEDERQFVPEGGQSWTDMDALARDYRIVWREEAQGLHSLTIEPAFAIGQRGFLIERPTGNILWDCLSLVDAETIDRIRGLGGLSAIAISHPHYYTAMVEWSRAFGGVPIYLHDADRQWVQRPEAAIQFWQGETIPIGPDATMIRCGGHFEGGAVLHCPWLADGRGALMSGDILQVVADRRHVSFMYSYPNLIPLDAAAVRRIVGAVEPFAFDAVYGAFGARTIARDGKAAVARSAERYLSAIAPREGHHEHR